MDHPHYYQHQPKNPLQIFPNHKALRCPSTALFLWLKAAAACLYFLIPNLISHFLRSEISLDELKCEDRANNVLIETWSILSYT